MSQIPVWLQITQSTATTVGVLLALWVAVWREPRKARDERDSRARQAEAERERHDAQIAALRQAEDERLAAQARRIVPAIFPGKIISNTLWNLRIDNFSTDAVSDIKIDIIIRDRNGNTVPHGYRLANRSSLAEIMVNAFLPEFSRAMNAAEVRFNEFIENMRTAILSLADPNDPQQVAAMNADLNAKVPNVKLELNEQTAAILQAQVRHAVQTLNDEWRTILAPGQFTAMAIETTLPEYTPHLQMRFEDSSGYRWERTDTEGPKRIHEPMR